MKSYERIEINPEVMFGKPVINGTRITVEHILRKLANGLSKNEIIEDHPHISSRDIQAAQRFAADYLSNDEIIFKKPSLP